MTPIRVSPWRVGVGGLLARAIPECGCAAPLWRVQVCANFAVHVSMLDVLFQPMGRVCRKLPNIETCRRARDLRTLLRSPGLMHPSGSRQHNQSFGAHYSSHLSAATSLSCSHDGSGTSRGLCRHTWTTGEPCRSKQASIARLVVVGFAFHRRSAIWCVGPRLEETTAAIAEPQGTTLDEMLAEERPRVRTWHPLSHSRQRQAGLHTQCSLPCAMVERKVAGRRHVLML